MEGEDQGYLLHIGGYSGTAGDSMTANGPSYHNNLMKFSTLDRDNDKNNRYHCAEYFKGGWWFNA